MFQLSQVLRKTDPDKAGQMMQSLSAARGLLIRQRMDQIIEQLDGRKFADALGEQGQVAEDLQLLLKLLLEEPSKLDERRAEIERLEALKKALGEVLEEQKKERQDSAALAEQPPPDLARLRAQLGELFEQQKQLSAQAATDADAAAMAHRQSELQRSAESLAEQIQSASGQAGERAEASRAGEQVGQASEHMGDAGQKLSEDERDAARADQQKAQEKLQEAIASLNEQVKKEMEKRKATAPPSAEQADAQRKTAEKTKKLAEKMEAGAGSCGPSESGSQPPQDSSGKSGKGGKSPDGQGQPPQGQSPPTDGQSPPSEGQSPQGPSQKQAPTPGTNEVKAATPHQQKAAEALEASKPRPAGDQQDKAIERLEDARQQLEETLEQLRKEQQEELLADLEARFRAMLAMQIECNKTTVQLADIGRDNWKRSDQLALAELGGRQGAVGNEADTAYQILKEEGTTVVFPRIVEHVRDDAREVAGRLAAAEVGPATRMMQESITDMLRELIDAVEKKQRESEQSEGGSQEPGDSQPPLLPGSAELKLLRACQIRVNDTTKAVRALSAEEGAQDADLAERLGKLAERQAQVHEMAEAMHESMRKAQ
jgi:hypothetical protein